MTDFIVKLAESLIPPVCVAPTLNLFTVACGSALLSKVLGYAVIVGSLLVKVPQITKIVNNGSAQGLNLVAVLIDLVAITFHLSYSYVSGFPFSAYGDGGFLALQTVLIGCLILHYSGSTVRAGALFIGYAVLCTVLMGGLTSLATLRSIQVLSIPIMLMGKGTQAVTNWRNGSTGQLSAITCAMMLFGSLARIFTSWQETGDARMILTYALSTSANAVIVAQLLWYWNAGAKKTKAPKTASADASDADASLKRTKPKSKKAD